MPLTPTPLAALAPTSLPRAAAMSPLGMPEDEPSLFMKAVGRPVLSGLGAVGNLLDLVTGASSLRDVLAGQNPFDQFLSPFSHENRTSGGDLLDRWGLMNKNASGVGPFAARLGTEMLFDPIGTFGTFGTGAYTKAGRVASRAGLMKNLGKAAPTVGKRVGRLRTSLGSLIDVSGPGAREAAEETAERMGLIPGVSLPELVGDVNPRQIRDAFRAVQASNPDLLQGISRIELLPPGRPENAIIDTVEGVLRINPDKPLSAGTLAHEATHLAQKRRGAIPEGGRMAMEPDAFNALEIEAIQAGKQFERAYVNPLDDLANQPLGGVMGFGLPFMEPAFTIGKAGGLGEKVAGGMDVLGKAIGTSPVGRGARMLFDPRVGGEYSQLGQEAQELAYGARPEANVVAREQFLDATDKMDETYRAFDEAFGGDIRRPLVSEIDPRDLDTALDEVINRRMATWNDPSLQAERQFRQRYMGLVRPARSGADPANIHPRFDEIVDEFRGTTGRVDATEDDVMEVLRRVDPRPTRSAPDVVKEAEGLAGEGLLKGLTPDHPFGPGDVVIASDRGNYGYVQRIGPKSSEVFFRNPETGATATKILPNDQLSRAFDAGSKEADDFSRLMTRKVYDDIVRMTAETGDPLQAFGELAPGLKPTTEIAEAIASRADEMKAANRAIYESIEAKGGKTRWLDEDFGIEHFPRYVNPKAKDAESAARVLPPSFGSMKGRSAETRNIPAAIVNRILREKRYRGPDSATRIAEDFGEYLDPWWGMDKQGFDFATSTPDISQHAQALSDWVKTHSKTDLYTNRTLDDFLKYQSGAQMTSRSLDAVHEFFRRHSGRGGDDAVDLGAAFRLAGMDGDKSLQHFAQTFKLNPEAAAKMSVPLEVVNAAKGVVKLYEKSGDTTWGGKIGEWVDGFNRMFKTWVTVPFPSFLSRNFVSGQHVNMATGLVEGPRDAIRYGKAFVEARRLAKAVQSGAELSPADAKILREIDLRRKDVLGDYGFEDVDYSGFVPETPGSAGVVPPRVLDRGTFREQAEQVAESPMFTDKIPGGRTVRTALRTWAGTGAKANKMVEWYNRVPLYLYLRQKGYTAEAASKAVESRHFDYGRLSGFERNIAKRGVPFYTFSRRVLPLITRTLMERPGGALGQTIRGTRLLQSDQPLPEYVGQTTAIPMGESEEGDQRFITGLGLAHEVPAAYLGAGTQGVLTEALSQLNPLIKGVVEWGTGESLFQRGPTGGRDLLDMDPTIGRTMTNISDLVTGERTERADPFLSRGFEMLAANSPASRILTTARTLVDPRKYEGPLGAAAMPLNLGTGLRITDISPAAQDAMLRDAASAVARESGAKSYETVYYPQELIADVAEEDPERAEQMEAFNRLRNLLARKAKERKKRRLLAAQ